MGASTCGPPWPLPPPGRGASLGAETPGCGWRIASPSAAPTRSGASSLPGAGGWQGHRPPLRAWCPWVSWVWWVCFLRSRLGAGPPGRPTGRRRGFRGFGGSASAGQNRRRHSCPASLPEVVARATRSFGYGRPARLGFGTPPGVADTRGSPTGRSRASSLGTRLWSRHPMPRPRSSRPMLEPRHPGCGVAMAVRRTSRPGAAGATDTFSRGPPAIPQPTEPP